MKITIIAAIGLNNELGKNNQLIWHLPSDLKFFKEKTDGKTIVMGRNTFESLPKLLPNRKHIVISSFNHLPKDVLVYKNIDELLETEIDDEIFVIGGGHIYQAFLPYADKMYLTVIDDTCENADTFFPSFNENDWNYHVIAEKEENNLKFRHLEYIRRRS